MENKLPEGWEWKKLGEIAEINPKFDKKSVSESTEVTFLPMKCIEELTGNVDTSITKSLEEVSKGYTPLIENDLIYAKITPCMENGKAAIATGLKNNLGFASTEFHVIRFKKNAYNKFFFFYLIQKRIREHAAMNMTGSAGQKRVPATFLKNLLVPLPPLETQQKIVSILEKAEETRKLRAQADELTQKLLQSVFLEIFGDPTKNSRGWDVRKLGEIITDSMNGLYLPKEKYTSHEGIKMVHMSDAFYGIVELGNLKRVLATKKEIDKYGLTKNDLLVARRSLNFEGAAKASKIPELNEPLIFESSLIKVSPDLKLVTTIYLYHYLNNELVRKTYIYKHITKSTISGINQNSLKNISVILPPIKVQNKFSDFVEQAEKTILNQQQSSLEINTLFDALMQKAFTGELVA